MQSTSKDITIYAGTEAAVRAASPDAHAQLHHLSHVLAESISQEPGISDTELRARIATRQVYVIKRLDMLLSNGTLLLAERGEKLVGMIGYEDLGKSDVFLGRSVQQLGRLCVDPDYRGGEIAELLMDCAIARVRAQIRDALTLFALVRHPKGQEQWMSKGFRPLSPDPEKCMSLSRDLLRGVYGDYYDREEHIREMRNAGWKGFVKLDPEQEAPPEVGAKQQGAARDDTEYRGAESTDGLRTLFRRLFGGGGSASIA